MSPWKLHATCFKQASSLIVLQAITAASCAESDNHSISTEDSRGRFGPVNAAMSPLGYNCLAASPPPPPSPTSKPEASSLSPDEIPVQLVAHPVYDGQECQATPLMICNFLQLTLNEPPSTTKVSAETDFMAMAKQQLFVSELPTPPTQSEGTPGHYLLPGVSLQACTAGHALSDRSGTCGSADLCRPSPLDRTAERAMQQCGGLASPQPCRSSGSQPLLVDAATSPGTPVRPQQSECTSTASTGKAASEQAAVQLCHSPAQAHSGSPWAGTPVCLRRNSNTASCTPEGGGDRPISTACVLTEGTDVGVHACSPELQPPVAAVERQKDESRTPRLHVMGNALSPLLRDACGRSAKSVLKDLLADLVEQERALDAQGSAGGPGCRRSPEMTTMSPMPKYDARESAEETVNVIASPLQRNASPPVQAHGTSLDWSIKGSGPDVVDPLTFDAVYDEAVQLHLAAGMGATTINDGQHAPQENRAWDNGNDVQLFEQTSEMGLGDSIASLATVPDQVQPFSPATTRVSTFSVQSALSCERSRSTRAASSTADTAAWLCPTAPVSNPGRGFAGKAGRSAQSGHGFAPIGRPVEAQAAKGVASRGTASTGRKGAAESGATLCVFACMPQVRAGCLADCDACVPNAHIT